MKIVKLKNISSTNIGNDIFLKIDIDLENLDKILILILHYSNIGHLKFILNYNINNIKLPYTKVLNFFMFDLFKFLKVKTNITIGFKGFPKCIYFRNILHSRNVWKYSKNIFYVDTNIKINNSMIFNICKSCKFYSSCDEVSTDYETLNGVSELLPILSNNYLSNNIKNKLNSFNNNFIKKQGFEILGDFKEEKEFLRKKFVFVDSYPKTLNESSIERFVYFIDNRKSDFDLTFNLLSKYFNIGNIKKYLKSSSEFALGFGLMGNKKLRKTFYFVIEDLSNSSILELSNILDLDIDLNNNYWGIGLDFFEEKLTSKKVYYKKQNVSKENLYNFISDFKFENLKVQKFIESLNNSTNSVLFDYKYKNDILFSKKLEISMQFDKHNYTSISNILEIDLNYFNNKEFYTISFEINNNAEEKINFYYTLK